jgi:hypothetical protein
MPAYPGPYYPDLQVLSTGPIGASGTFTVQTKFRQVDTYFFQPIYQVSSTLTLTSTLADAYFITSKAGGTIYGQLVNGSTQISSGYSAYIFATGVM